MNYITWHDLAFLILFILGSTALVYLIILIRNVNEGMKVVKTLLKEQQENIHNTLQTLPEISGNIARISDTVKNNMKVVETAIHNIGETVEMTAATAQTIKNDILGKVTGFFELIDLIWRVFFKSKPKDEHINSKKDGGGA